MSFFLSIFINILKHVSIQTIYILIIFGLFFIHYDSLEAACPLISLLSTVLMIQSYILSRLSKKLDFLQFPTVLFPKMPYT